MARLCVPALQPPNPRRAVCPRRPGAGALPGGLQPLAHAGHRLPDAAAADGRARRALRRAAEPRDRPQRRLPAAALPAQRAPAQGGQAPALGHRSLRRGGARTCRGCFRDSNRNHQAESETEFLLVE